MAWRQGGREGGREGRLMSLKGIFVSVHAVCLSVTTLARGCGMHEQGLVLCVLVHHFFFNDAEYSHRVIISLYSTIPDNNTTIMKMTAAPW